MTQASGPFSLNGKTALITGASRGIGAALAAGLADAGAHVILSARTGGECEAAAAEIRSHGRRASWVVLDVRDCASIDSAMDRIGREYGGLDILVNNAGVEQLTDSDQVDEATWDMIVGTNLRGAFFCSQSAARLMRPAGRGSIVNLCSLTSVKGVSRAAPYGASKAGLLGLTRTLASEWAGDGIRVNGLGPGYFHTEMTDVFYQDKTWVGSMLDKIPLRRFGELQDLTGAAVFLCSEAAGYVTGQVLYVDGGILARL